MQRDPLNSQLVQKKLNRAATYVGDLWFPVNPKLLAKIRSGLQAGEYNQDPSLLVSHITEDFALFTYCLKNLAATVNREDHRPFSDPVELLRNASLSELKHLLELEDQKHSYHTLDGMSDFQRARIQEYLISASSAKVLAPHFKIDPEVGFAAALMRQLGHTLIAWNYPTVYESALKETSDDQSLTKKLTERLGFSPELLAIRILKSWGVSDLYCNELFGEPPAYPQDSTGQEISFQSALETTSGTLSRLCSIGEALAKAHDPEHYPNTQREWEFAKRSIESYLGTDGMRLIQQSFVESFEDYLDYVPELFDPGFFELEQDEDETTALSPLERNGYVALCANGVRIALVNLYSTLRSNQIVHENLRFLIREIVPKAGFSGGCVYTVDPTQQILIAQTRIGKLRLKEFSSVDYSLIKSDSDSIAVAYRSQDPVIEYGTDSKSELLVGISGSFGYARRLGVLYLELPEAHFIKHEEQLKYHFEALRRALADCLNAE